MAAKIGPTAGQEAVSMGTILSRRNDVVLLLQKAIQECQNHDHRHAMMLAKDAIEEKRALEMDLRKITIVRERYEELLKKEQEYDNLVLRIKLNQHLRH